ncbi:MAG TPA: sigma-54-dependent Fis family transcriptional regulator [bacterium]|nr:sigma-54-dependent Fis family transcriptional regulator [bacterium]
MEPVPKENVRILIADDNRSHSDILMSIIGHAGFECDAAEDGTTALKKLETETYDLVLLDLKLPDISGMTVLRKVLRLNCRPQVVMISGQGSVQAAVEAIKIGAFDFLEKPLDSKRVLLTVKNALEKERLVRDKARLMKELADRYTMVGQSTGMDSIREMISRAADTTSKVLIEGENGTGKELIARLIHHQGPRSGGPFVTINCAAIPETLIESELFGFKKGSFTGALTDRKGKFQSADGGTLFLDEIGDMSLLTQAKVLRVLESGMVEQLGGSEAVRTDVRLIAATNKDLKKQIERGEFREDLYFRLNVLNIKVPPLRQRKEDIELLVDYFSSRYCRAFGAEPKRFSPGAVEFLKNYKWPGNIRELKNAVEKIMVTIENSEVHPQDIDGILHPGSSTTGLRPFVPLTLREARSRFEKELIQDRLERNHWNITRTAIDLGITRIYLHRLMKDMGIKSRRKPPE